VNLDFYKLAAPRTSGSLSFEFKKIIQQNSGKNLRQTTGLFGALLLEPWLKGQIKTAN
jgi:hypothetical protein